MAKSNKGLQALTRAVALCIRKAPDTARRELYEARRAFGGSMTGEVARDVIEAIEDALVDYAISDAANADDTD